MLNMLYSVNYSIIKHFSIHWKKNSTYEKFYFITNVESPKIFSEIINSYAI